jgi:energy-coupling factor transporter transmembrane protein EcfT
MFTRRLDVLVAIYFLCAFAALVSYIRIGRYLGRNLLIVAALALPMAILGSLAVVTPGETFLRIGSVHFTHQGVRGVAFVVLRSLDAVSITMLLVRSAGLHGVVRGLREIGLPASIVAACQMTIAHLHILARTAHAMILAFRSRTVSPPSLRNTYAVTGNQGAVLLRKSMAMSRDVHAAMLARGFSGQFPELDSRSTWQFHDYLILAMSAGMLIIGILL